MLFMNLFDMMVSKALENQPDLSPLRIVVEKELLHHDIMRILSEHDFLKELTFIGGTCLRSCYGSIRLSEDLDFTGGIHFTRTSLSAMGAIITKSLYEKYGLSVQVSEPIKDKKNVDTWKIKIETRPEKKYFPAQRINIDICAVASYEKVPVMLLNPYGVSLGTDGLIIQAESREEIFTDKILACALRPNRIKYRDLWDIMWLHQKNVHPRLKLINSKLEDRRISLADFLHLFEERKNSIKKDGVFFSEFLDEMNRFLPASYVQKTMHPELTQQFVFNLLNDIFDQMQKQS